MKRKRGRPRGSKNKPRRPVIKITETNMEREGLYTSPSEESFKSVDTIKREAFEKASVEIEESLLPAELSFEELHDEAVRRSDFRDKVEGELRNVDISIDSKKPIAIAWFSDTHVGNAGVDYCKLKDTAQVIKEHPLVYCITGGDITDSLFFDYGEEIMNMQEQYFYMYKMLNWIGAENILAGVQGNHDSWSRKQGVTNYINFAGELKRPLLRGTSFVNLTVGQSDYRIMLAHKFKGSSIYNPNHPQVRAGREVYGADIIMSAHNHRPGEANIYQKEFGGGGKKITLIAGKTFKKYDAYGKDHGFHGMTDDEIGCNYLILNHDKRLIRTASSTEEMLETMGQYL